jgi:hypothetical protein
LYDIKEVIIYFRESAMLKRTVRNLSLLCLLFLAHALQTAWAGKALSWNFKQDTIGGIPKNPNGAWAYMQNNPINTNPAKFTLLPTYQAACNLSRWGMPLDKNLNCWQDLASHAAIMALSKGNPYPYMHPGYVNQIIIRWTSPINGDVSVLGTINSDNAACGDGIKWFVKTATNNLLAGVLKHGEGRPFFIRILPVKKGSPVYFIIDKNKNNDCDGSSLDLLITSQQ